MPPARDDVHEMWRTQLAISSNNLKVRPILMDESWLLQNEAKLERVLTKVEFEFDKVFENALTRNIFDCASRSDSTFNKATFGSLL